MLTRSAPLRNEVALTCMYHLFTDEIVENESASRVTT